MQHKPTVTSEQAADYVIELAVVWGYMREHHGENSPHAEAVSESMRWLTRLAGLLRLEQMEPDSANA